MSKTAATLIASTLAMMMVGAGCASTSEYSTTGKKATKGADAKISLETGESGNQSLVVDVEHLIPADRLGEDFSAYVVWIVVAGREPELAGILSYDGQTRRGSLQTSTPHRDFQVVVTAEKEDRPQAPSSKVVIRQNVSASS